MLQAEVLLEMREYVEFHLNGPLLAFCAQPMEAEYKLPDLHEHDLYNFIENKRKPSLWQTLFRFIDDKGMSDPEVYHKAGIDRKHFSKIRSNQNYRPGKNTVIALALALELDRDEADALLSSAGYSLSDSDTGDLVIQFCLEKQIYQIHDVNQALDSFSLKPLTGSI